MFEWKQPISKEVFNTKYMIHGEKNIEEVFTGIAKEISSVEKTNSKLWEEKFYDLMINRHFIPAGRIMANARPGSKIKNYNNCFVINIEDRLESITRAISEYMWILKQGGGVGFNISKLRPKGESLSTGGESSGPLSFLEIFNTASKTIQVGGQRRGASICILNVDHPDIEEFITYKQGDNNKRLTQFNISVGITDNFIKSVKSDSDWDLRWEGKIFKTVKAKELYDKITYNAFQNAEPGIFNIDHVNNNNPLRYIGEMEAVNPCFSGDSLITTKYGVFPIIDLIGKEVEVYNGNEWEVINNFRKTGENQDLIKIELSSGVYFNVTPYHTFYLEDGTKIQAKDLKEGDKLEYNEELMVTEGISAKGAYLKGFLISDGTMEKNSKRPILWVYEPKYACEKRLKDSAEEIEDIRSYRSNNIEAVNFIQSSVNRKSMQGISCRDGSDLYKWASEYKESFPKEVFSWDLKSKCDFIAGLMDGDGTVLDNKHSFGIQFTSKYKEFLVDFLRLLSTIGIYGKLNNDKSRKCTIVSKTKEGLKEYSFGRTYRITIPQKYAIELSRLIKFERLQDLSNKTIKYNIKFRYNKIVSIEKLPKKETVYCCTTKTNKVMVNSGIITGQCGEVPMYVDKDYYGSCNLGSLYLPSFVSNPFSENAIFNYTAFKEAVRVSIRFLDDVLDAMEAPLQQIDNEIIRSRRLGLGFTGLADTMAMLGITYGSNDSKTFVTFIGQDLRNFSYKASIDIAKEKGVFKGFDKINYMSTKWFSKLPKDIQEGIEKYGIRNGTLNSIAPTGTISITVGQNCSSGIEPIFALEYQRKIRIGSEEEIKVEQVYNSAYLDFITMYPDEKIPSYFITANEINPKDEIDIQAILQKYIDLSISKTCSLPKEFKYEEYKDLFMYAYDKGLKGFTSFWEGGSLSGILIRDAEEHQQIRPDFIQRSYAPKRPEWLECDIHSISINKEKHIVLVGKLNGTLYEMFVTNDPEDKIETGKYKKGFIVKKSKSTYDLIVQNGAEKTIITDITSIFDEEYGSLSRMISMSLRHGVPLEYIVQQLQRDKNFIGFEKSVSRVLKKYIKDGEKVTTEKCPDCGGDLIFQDGCVTCRDCGVYSKCG